MIDWDGWRRGYDGLTFADQKAFYERVAVLYPEQAYHDADAANAAFDSIGGDLLSVVELGGWDGQLAASMLERGDIASWRNYDLVAVPQACSHPGYRLDILDDYLWAGEVEADVFVACHMIEHITARELGLLFDALSVDWVYLEAPLKEDGRSWRGSTSSHILDIGWRDIDGMLEQRGFRRDRPGLWAA